MMVPKSDSSVFNRSNARAYVQQMFDLKHFRVIALFKRAAKVLQSNTSSE